MLERRLTAWLRPVLMLVASTGILSLAACGGGSGAPNNPYAPAPAPITPVVVQPAEGVAYAGVPYTLTINGGVAPYTAVSSNPAILPVAQNIPGSNVVLMAANTESDLIVGITVRDSIAQTAVATVLVRPALLLPNAVTITGSPACTGGGQLCSGTTGTAKVKVTGPANAGIPNRQVRFEVVQGSYSIMSNNPAQPLVQTLTVVTDQNGDAIVGLSVPPNAVSQLGVIRAIEVTSGMQITGQFTIVQQITGTNIVTTIPSGKTTLVGPYKGVCASGARVTFYIFGGTPPYRVSTDRQDALSIVGAPVNVQGGGFDVIPNGTCFTNATFAIVDANGLTVTNPPVIDNTQGEADAPAPTPAKTLSVVPTTGYSGLSASNQCAGKTFPFVVTEGTPPYNAYAPTPLPAGSVINPQTLSQSGDGFSVTLSPNATSVGNYQVGVRDSGATPQVVIREIKCDQP